MLGFLIKYAGLIFNIVVAVITGVQAAEKLEAPGADKKTIVLAALKAILGRFGIAPGDALMNLLSSAVDVVVALLNALGIFKHAATPTATGSATSQAASALRAQDEQLEAASRPSALAQRSRDIETEIQQFIATHKDFGGEG